MSSQQTEIITAGEWVGVATTPISQPKEINKEFEDISWEKEEIGTFSQFIIPRSINYRNNYTLSMVSRREEIMNFNKIRYEDKEIKLRTPIEIKPKLSNQRYTLHYEPLDIIVSAPTQEVCKEDFQEELDVLYEVIAREDDENLIKSAQIIKRKLLNLIADET